MTTEWVLWCRMGGREPIRYRIGSYARVMREAEAVVHSPHYSDWRLGRPGEPVERATPLRWSRRGFEPVREQEATSSAWWDEVKASVAARRPSDALARQRRDEEGDR